MLAAISVCLDQSEALLHYVSHGRRREQGESGSTAASVALEEWSHFLYLDGARSEEETVRRYTTVRVCVCVRKACGPWPTEMMDDGMCTHNPLSRLPLH